MERVASPLVCSCTPDDDPECPVHGCTCSSVAAHLVSPCAWGKNAATARHRQSETRQRTAEDRREAYNRAQVVRSILERCHAELLALQCIPHLTADDVNELGAAKGFAERALLALGRLPL
jgi:hypothetical protein